MNLSIGSVRRPIFFASLVILMLIGGLVAMRALPVDSMPKVDIPYVVVSVQYPGAGPKEVETVITKPLEEELISLEGLKNISSTSQDSFSQITLEFHLGLPSDSIEQKVRDRIALAKVKFPSAVKEPTVMKYDPNSMSVLTLSIRSTKLDRVKLTEWVDRDLKPQLSQVPKIGKLEILGGLKREVHVVVDAKKLDLYRMPLIGVSDQIAKSGENSPGGIIRQNGIDVGVKNLGEYSSFESLENRVVSFTGGEFPIRISDLGKVMDGTERETSRAFQNGEAALIVDIYRQSGANVIQVTDQLKAKITSISKQLKSEDKGIEISVVMDGAKEIRDNVWDVQEAILIGIALTVLVVYLFLASARSTLITGLALPNSLLGAFVLMYLMGFSINIMTLLALSLAVGLLIDDAIVVRENIFKHLEEGKSPVKAALDGTKEVTLAVVATTVAIMAVFGPVAFIPGMIGQFFKEFGLTVCFAMLISLFDALTIAPMLSAYWGGKHGHDRGERTFLTTIAAPFVKLTSAFNRMQGALENGYRSILAKLLRFPKSTVALGVLVATALIGLVVLLPSTFMPRAEPTALTITVTLPPGAPLDASEKAGRKLQSFIDEHEGVSHAVLTIGNVNQETNVITSKITLKSSKQRNKTGTQISYEFREKVEALKAELPNKTESQIVAGTDTGMGFPITFTVQSDTSEGAAEYAAKLVERMKESPLLQDVHSTQKPAKPEITLKVDPVKAGRFGISEGLVGQEIRGHIEGIVAGRYRDQGREIDVRVLLEKGAERFNEHRDSVLVPNLNMTTVKLVDVAKVEEGSGLSKLERRNRSASVTVNAGLTPGVGLGAATEFVNNLVENEMKPIGQTRIVFQGDAESFEEMGNGFAAATGFGIILLYLVLASLYESFFVPVVVMVALPLAAGGAFLALLMAGQGIDMYSLIGILLLLGVATKNSILMVDTVAEKLREETTVDLQTFIRVVLDSCVRRLRPIIMTSMALVAGMIPIAIGLNEASAQRTSMGTAVIGGTISSTLLTLLLLPALLLLVRKRVTNAALVSAKRNKLVDEALDIKTQDSVHHS